MANVIGYGVLEAEFIAHPWQFVREECQDLRDVWMFTTYHTVPLVFCKVSQAHCGTSGVPVQAQAEHLSRHARKWFFCRLVAAFPQAADMATSLAMYVPCPHALLTLEGKWPQCAFPRVLRGRHSAAWIHGRELLMANGIPEPDQQLVPAEVSRRTADWNLNPESLLSLGRNLQDLLSFTTPNAMAAATATANVHLLILHKMREQMLLQGALMSQTIYDLEQVVPICVDRCRAQSSDASSQRASTLFASVGPGPHYSFTFWGIACEAKGRAITYFSLQASLDGFVWFPALESSRFG